MRLRFTSLLLVTALSAGCIGAAPSPPPASQDAAASPPAHHVIRMLAVEWKGGANIATEPYPGDAHMPEGNGYGMAPPDETGRWQVNAYRWDPGTIVVRSGDTVTLDIFGVNGAVHESEVEGHGVTFTVKRGVFTNVTFTAGAPSIYRIMCHTHAPVMEAQLVVLPAETY